MRPAEPAEPIDDAALDALFASFEKASRIALAVSGGGDSLALLLLIDRWRKRGRKPQPIVLTVDHRLRPNSAEEAERVAAIARERGLAARVLVSPDETPAADIEASARATRYRLLIAAAREVGASHLLVAHHRDDQAENFLMRLERGAGAFGLAAMRPEIATDDIIIARPLLDLPRARLRAIVAASGLTSIVDPMNSDPRFLRARIRNLLPGLATEGIDAAALATTSQRLAEAADALDDWAGSLIGETVSLDELAVARLDPGPFFSAPAAVRNRALSRLILAIGGETYPPRYDRLVALSEAMQERKRGRFKRTLGGVVVEWRERRFVFYREFGREGLPVRRVAVGFDGIWDRRFHLKIGPGAPDELELAALGEDGRSAVGARAQATPPGAVAVLPALRRRGAVLVVPSLSYWAAGRARFPVEVRSLLDRRLAQPPRFPDFGARN